MALALTVALTLAALAAAGAGAVEPPGTGAFEATGSLSKPHGTGSTATTLANGKVLVVGGLGAGTSVELYDPVFGTWASSSTCGAPSPTCPAPTNLERRDHAATLLVTTTPATNGKVLVTGDSNRTVSVELYDPDTGRWASSSTCGAPSPTCPAPMNRGRTLHTATLLGDGTVLAAGGLPVPNVSIIGPSPAADTSTERYNPATGQWTLTAGALNSPRSLHTATLINRGDCANNCGGVLVAGGFSDNQETSEIYLPSFDRWFTKNDMNQGRRAHTATLLPSGEVMVAGGSRSNNGTADTFGLTSVERWNPAAPENLLLGEQWTTVSALTVGRTFHTATLLPNAKQVLLAGGRSSAFPNGADSAELYGIAANTWTNFTASAFDTGDAALLPSGPLAACGRNCGKVLLTYGPVSTPPGTPGSFAELYTPNPELTKLAPASGPATGGTAVTLEGSGLADVTSVKFGTLQATSVENDAATPDAKLVALSPAQAEGAVPVTVTSRGGSSLQTMQFTYTAASTGGGGGSGGGSGGSSGGSDPILTVPGGGGAPIGTLPPAAPAPTGAGDGAALAAALAREDSRRLALRTCLAPVTRHTRRENLLARSGSALARRLARRHARRHARVLRGRCLRRHGRTPGQVTGLSASALERKEVVLSFRAPGSDRQSLPPARSYLVKQSATPITDLRGFRAAQSLCGGVCRFPLTRVGEEVKLRITGLRPRTTYHYAIAARDNVSRRLGPRSQTVRVRTK